MIDVLPTITKQSNEKVRSSTKLTPIKGSLKKNAGFAYNNLLNKRKNVKPKFQVHDLVRVGDLRKMFAKGDTTNWSYIVYQLTKIFNDTIQS